MYSRNQLAYQAGIIAAYRSIKSANEAFSRVSKALNPIIKEFEYELLDGWTFKKSIKENSGEITINIEPVYSQRDYPEEDMSRGTFKFINSNVTDLASELRKTIKGLGLNIVEFNTRSLDGLKTLEIILIYPDLETE